MGVAGELQLGGSSGGPHKVVGGAGVGGLEEGVWWELVHRKNHQDLMVGLTKEEEESGMNLRF